MEKYAIDQITGIRFYGPNHFLIVGMNGIMVGFEITGGENSVGKSKLRGVKFAWKRDVEIARDEIIDTYDVLVTGKYSVSL